MRSPTNCHTEMERWAWEDCEEPDDRPEDQRDDPNEDGPPVPLSGPMKGDGDE